MLALLIAKGADPNAGDEQGQTPLVLGISRGERLDSPLFDFLLAHGASLTAFGSDGQTPLHAAAARGEVDLVNRLLSKGVNVNIRGGSGDTPLHAAIQSSALKVVTALLNSGADVNLRNDRGDTPLHAAMRLAGLPSNSAASHSDSGRVYYSFGGSDSSRPGEAIEAILIQHGAQVALRDQYGLTPLLYALLNRDRAGRTLLLAHHAPVDTQTALFMAAALDDIPTLTRLTRADPALLAARAPNGATLLHVAAVWDARQSVAWLLHHGLDTTVRDAFALSPLHYACRAPNAPGTAADLLAAGANIAARDGAGDTPLHFAARAGGRETIALLLSHHAAIGASNGSGETPLLALGDLSHTDILALLLNAGADPNLSLRWGGEGLLARAVNSGSKDAVALLLAKGADPNPPDNYGGGSPLIRAIQMGNKDLVALLLDKGADPTAKTPWGETPLSAAKNFNRNPEIIALLQAHLPPPTKP